MPTGERPPLMPVQVDVRSATGQSRQVCGTREESAFTPTAAPERTSWYFAFGPMAAITDRPAAESAAPRRLDRGDVDLLHGHHRVKRALCFIAAGCHRFGQHTRRDLPRHAPLVLAPAARALLAAIADDGVPIVIGLGLIVGGDHEREGFAVLELGTAVEADAGHAGHLEFDHQHIALLAGRVVAGRTPDVADRTVGKGRGIK